MRGNRVHTQRKRSIDAGLDVQNDQTKRRAKACEPDGLPFPSSYTHMTAPCVPQERGSGGTRRKGPSVPPVQPVEAGAERTCAYSHHSAKRRPNSTEKPGIAAPGNGKIIGGHHAPQVQLPRFSLGSSFFHSIVCYHAKTEGDYANNLSFELSNKIRQLSLADVNFKIPRYAWGTWPFFAKKPASFVPNEAKVYLNRECLQDGQDWEVGIIDGLSSSMVMVCLLSFHEDGRGSLGNLTTLKPSEGKDRVDHFLLELIIGHELRALGEYTALCAILPILIGPQRQDSSFAEFPFGKLGLLSREP